MKYFLSLEDLSVCPAVQSGYCYKIAEKHSYIRNNSNIHMYQAAHKYPGHNVHYTTGMK